MSDTPREVSLDQVMASVDESRRAVLKRLLAGGAILAVPLITALGTSDEAYGAAKEPPKGPPITPPGKGGKKGKGF